MTQQRSHNRERGQVVPIAALLMIVIVGFAALIIDGGRGYVDRRDLQAAADTAALAGANQLGGKLQAHNYSVGCAVAAAVQQAANNLPGAQAPGLYDFATCASFLTNQFVYATTTPINLQDGYTLDVSANLEQVKVTVHHSLSLTFGIAAGFGPSMSPAATATAVNGALPFALVLFHSIPDPTQNCPTSSLCNYENLNLNGGAATVLIKAAGTSRGDALSNEGICLNSGQEDFNHSGDQYAYVPTFASNSNPGNAGFPGNCGSSSQILNTTSVGDPQAFPIQLPDPAFTEPGNLAGVTTCNVGTCNWTTPHGTGSTDQVCIIPGVYTSIHVTKGILVLNPGVYKITGTSGGSNNVNNFSVDNGASVVTADKYNPAGSHSGPCPGSTLSSADSAVSIIMVPQVSNSGNSWDVNQLVVTQGTGDAADMDKFTVHSCPAYNHIVLYIEHTGDTCTTYATSGMCGTSVVDFSSASSYSLTGLVYGYADNMTFNAAGTDVAGVGQVFAWTLTVSGNAGLTETYDPSQLPFLQGLLQ
jgi:Flp pilus assembly protein TadG